MALAAMFPTRQFFDNVGKPLDGGMVYTYQAGTTTPLVSFADAKYVAALPNPVVLDGAGRAQIFLLPRAYKLTVKDKGNVTVEVIDNYQGQSGELTVTQISAAYTPDYDDDVIEVVAGGPFSITLPSAVDHAGKVYLVKSLAVAAITIDPDGGETIDGAATYVLNGANQATFIWSDGANWKVQTAYSGVAPVAAASLSHITPSQGKQGSSVAVTLTGTNFVAGSTIAVSGGGVTVNTVIATSAQTLTANFVIVAGAPLGARSVTVTSPGGTSFAQIFTVIAPGVPTLASISPASGSVPSSGMNAVNVKLTGTNFTNDALNIDIQPSAGVAPNSLDSLSETEIVIDFEISAGAAKGPRAVKVTGIGGTSNTQTFTIT